MKESITIDFAGRPLTVSTGELAKQADGSVLVTYGETVVLVTAVCEKTPKELDFLPLTVNYQEMSYAAGKFPGGFFKREGKPSDREVLMSRLIDRPLRPLFPKGFRQEIQVIATVLSADQINDPAIPSILGASCAVTLSCIPFDGPLAGVKVGRRQGQFVINPTNAEDDESDMDIVVVATRDAIIMVEGGAEFVKGADLIEAIHLAHEKIQPLIDLQEELRKRVGVEKLHIEIDERPQALERELRGLIEGRLIEAYALPGKHARAKREGEILEDLLAGPYAETEPVVVKKAFELVSKNVMRDQLFATGKRIDGRGTEDIRPVSCAVGLLPRTHGSALFTRGETQALAVTTFGTSEDEQKIESLHEGLSFKSFLLHYNFPPFSVGEVAMLRAPTRREVGHGNLAERALLRILPAKEDFPYTIRVVSEILESNGSSSMATVCAGCLALMDAGTPVKEPVAGVAMGLVKGEQGEIILSDILGDEDHMGDMDFKIAGGRSGITAIQMDIKIKGISKETMSKAVQQAERGVAHILGIMEQTMPAPRTELSPYAPRFYSINIRPERIKDVIGPGGKIIKSIVEQTGVKIDIEDSGVVRIAAQDVTSAGLAIEMIKKLTREVEVGAIYLGRVKKVLDAGAVVELFPGGDGFCHVSQLADGYVKKASDVAKEGDEMLVKVLEVEANGRVRLSRKAALKEKQKSQQE